MALQIENYVSGRIHNIVFFKRSGTYIARMQPAVVKHSAATKIRSRNFGLASATGKTLRQLLLPVLPFPKNRSMQIKFSGAIAQWLGLSDPVSLPVSNAIPFIDHFQFNDSTSIAERWKLPLTVMQPSANLVEVNIPAFVPATAIAAPAHTSMVECTITAAACLLADGTALGSFTQTISIPYNDTLINAQTLSLPVPTNSGAIVVTAACLQYYLTNGQYNSNPAFMPASVIDARYY